MIKNEKRIKINFSKITCVKGKEKNGKNGKKPSLTKSERTLRKTKRKK